MADDAAVTVPDETVPDETVPDETVPDETVPDETVPWRHLLVVAVAGAIVATVLSLVVFTDGSAVVDERVYQQAAIALADGHLTLPATFTPDHTPFFTAPNDRGELMFKYSPLWPAVLAVSKILTGSTRSAVPVGAFVALLGNGLLAFEVTRRRRTAVIATVVVAVCPLFLVLAATQLAYCFSLALVAWTAALVLRAGRTGSIRVWAAAGFVGGLGFFHRPFDLVLFAAPFVVWVIVTQRPALGRAVAGAAAGAVVPLGALLATDWRITGSAFTLPYSAVGPKDLPGYGPRLDVHDGTPFDFTFVKGLKTLAVGMEGLGRWAPLAGLGLVVAVIGWRRLGARRGWLCAAVFAIVPLAYVSFWGAWNGYVRLRTDLLMGPMYYLPVIVPLAIGVAEVLRTLDRRRSAAIVAAGLVLSGLLVQPSVDRLVRARDFEEDRHREVDAMQSVARGRPALLIVNAPWLLYRFPIFNEADLDGPTVGAIDVAGRGATLLTRFPDRRAVRRQSRYVLEGRPGAPSYVDGFGFDRQDVIEALELRTGTELTFTPAFPGDDASTLTFQVGDEAWSWAQPPAGAALRWDGDEAHLDGLEPAAIDPPHPDLADGLVCVGRLGADDSPTSPADFDEVCFDTARRGDQLSAVVPGRPYTRFALESVSMLLADVSDRITVEVGSS